MEGSHPPGPGRCRIGEILNAAFVRVVPQDSSTRELAIRGPPDSLRLVKGHAWPPSRRGIHLTDLMAPTGLIGGWTP